VTVALVIQLNASEFAAQLLGPNGPMAQDVIRRGNNVRTAAVRNMRAMGIGNKVGTGTLMGSIVVEMISLNGLPAVRVGSRLPYALYVHEGTGIYGPRGQPIRPVRGRFLRWPNINQAAGYSGGRYTGRRRYKAGRTAAFVFAREVKGVPPRRFLTEALKAAAL
jgi:hypothetical protein